MFDAVELSTFGLGLLLGGRHALDADHIAAVSTITSQTASIRRSCRIGAAWGFGHTLILFVLGGLMLVFKFTIPDHWAKFFEACVGIMLVGLGLSVGLALLQERVHVHPHFHPAEPIMHAHWHVHHDGLAHSHSHRLPVELKSLCIGMVHGLAGTAMVPLLILSTAQSSLQGMIYLCVFGIGSIAGMVAVAAVLSLPLVYAPARFGAAQKGLRAAAGAASVAIGSSILYSVVS